MAVDRAADLCSRVLEEIEAKIQRLLRGLRETGAPGQTLLDVGCWDGAGTLERAQALGACRLLGVEIFEGPAAEAERKGIEVARIDLEADRFPWPDGSADVVVCNQVLEHLKNVWRPMGEMHRVLAPGGHAILSVPNLGSFHNRLMLAFGRQPSSIRVFGPHVRGYTMREFRELIGRGGAFEVERTLGAGFYPVPSPWSAPLSAVWRGGSHSTVVLARKASDRDVWREHLSEGSLSYQTFYPVEAPDRAAGE